MAHETKNSTGDPFRIKGSLVGATVGREAHLTAT
jgi:hypothetical protein